MNSLVLQSQGHSCGLNFHSKEGEEEKEEEREGDSSRVSTSGQVCASNRCWAKWGFREARSATGREQGCLIRTLCQRRRKHGIAQWIWKRSLEGMGCPSMKTQVWIPSTTSVTHVVTALVALDLRKQEQKNDKVGSS